MHTVVTADGDLEVVLNAFKANATRKLREKRFGSTDSVHGVKNGSKRRLWHERSVAQAIEYVSYGQGDDLPKFDDE